jgi:cardiolipin synthase
MQGRIWTVPNQITFLRLGILPFFLILISYQRYGWALAAGILAGLSDSVDGLLARRLHQRSSLGAYLDPIADKLLLSSSFVVLAFDHRINWWLTILVLSRDLIILVVAAVIILSSGYRRFPPTIYGKYTTFFQILFVFVILLEAVAGWPWLVPVNRGLVYLVAALTVFSGFHYSIIIARRLHSA